jgi:hypothetical protein
MKTICRIAALAVGLAGIMMAETNQERWNTCGLYNGRYWQDFATDEMHHLAFLGGVMSLISAQEDKDNKWIWTQKMTVGEMSKSLDKVYQDPANMRIPIVFALAVASSRFNGATEKDITMFEVKMRRYAQTCQWEDDKKKEE